MPWIAVDGVAALKIVENRLNEKDLLPDPRSLVPGSVARMIAATWTMIERAA